MRGQPLDRQESSGRWSPWIGAAALAVLAAWAGAALAAPGAATVEKLAGGVVIDWSAGRIAAPGGAAADLRAPNADVARVGAERVAGDRARAALAEAVRALPLAGGGTVGARVDADPASAARLGAVLGRARPIDVSYAADGGARVILAAPLEAVRAAVSPPPLPAADPVAPTALVIDARKTAVRPVLGVRLTARGGAGKPLAFPTVWHDAPAAAAADVRAGARPRQAAASGYDRNDGTLTVELDAAELESAARAGALILVVIEGAKK